MASLKIHLHHQGLENPWKQKQDGLARCKLDHLLLLFHNITEVDPRNDSLCMFIEIVDPYLRKEFSWYLRLILMNVLSFIIEKPQYSFWLLFEGKNHFFNFWVDLDELYLKQATIYLAF